MITILAIIVVIIVYKKIFEILKKMINNIIEMKKVNSSTNIYRDINNNIKLNDAITEEEYILKKNINNTVIKKEEIQSVTYKNNINQNLPNLQNNNEINYRNFYKPRRYVTTLNELIFYQTLLEICKELDLILFSQVSLYNIIEVKQNLNNSLKTTYFNKINKKSIDFVLVDKKNCRIKLCIELDDYTHQRKDRIKRDKFINELFKQLNINLLRYPVYSKYNKEILKRKIQEKIKENYYF